MLLAASRGQQVAERVYVWRERWEETGTAMYAQGWRVIGQEYGGAYGLVQRYIVEKAGRS